MFQKCKQTNLEELKRELNTEDHQILCVELFEKLKSNPERVSHITDVNLIIISDGSLRV